MSFAIGIVGLPNVGKSTLFQALTKQQVETANYPFCTIEPNVGVVPVPDERLAKLAQVSHSAKIIPTVIEFFDIAGLVKGASTGEGLGNKFLSHIKQVDAICQVIRVFPDDNVTHVHGKPDPTNDLETINLELALADLQVVTKRKEAWEREAKAGLAAPLKVKLGAMQKLMNALENGRFATTAALTDDEHESVKELQLLTLKPMLYVANTGERESLSLPPLSPLITINARLEAELADLPAAEVKEFLTARGEHHTGLEKLILAGYQLLKLCTFFTSGPEETKAWTVKHGTPAPEAAGVIHTDFTKGFIKAEVINWQDYVALGGETGAKQAGKMRIEGKNYELKDGDVCYFHVNT